MVSHVSDGAVAALGVANQFVVLALICFNFIGIGASVVITTPWSARTRPSSERRSVSRSWKPAVYLEPPCSESTCVSPHLCCG